MRKLIKIRLLKPRQKRKVNRAFNAYIQPRASDIEQVERERRERRNLLWEKKGCQI